MIVLNQSLAQARLWLACHPPARTERVDQSTGRPYTTVVPREWIRAGGAALAACNLVLRASDSRAVVAPGGPALQQRFTLRHAYAPDEDAWTREQPLDTDAPMALASAWAETRNLAGAIKGLLWDTSSEDVPDPSDRPARKVEDSRTQAQVQEDARRNGNGAPPESRACRPPIGRAMTIPAPIGGPTVILDESKGGDWVVTGESPGRFGPVKGAPHTVPADASMAEHLGLKPGDGLPAIKNTDDESSAPPAASSPTPLAPEGLSPPSGAGGGSVPVTHPGSDAPDGARVRFDDGVVRERHGATWEPAPDAPPDEDDRSEEQDPPGSERVTLAWRNDGSPLVALVAPTAEQVNVVANVVEGSRKLATNSAAPPAEKRCKACGRLDGYAHPAHPPDFDLIDGCECPECCARCFGDPWDCGRAAKAKAAPLVARSVGDPVPELGDYCSKHGPIACKPGCTEPRRQFTVAPSEQESSAGLNNAAPLVAGPADTRGMKRAERLRSMAARPVVRETVKRSGGACAIGCGVPLKRGDEVEIRGGRRVHVVCPRATSEVTK